MFLSIFYLYRESSQFLPSSKMAVIQQNAIQIMTVCQLIPCMISTQIL